jgi:DNA-directed RNA polymerase subunit RPC12/RpoP
VHGCGLVGGGDGCVDEVLQVQASSMEPGFGIAARLRRPNLGLMDPAFQRLPAEYLRMGIRVRRLRAQRIKPAREAAMAEGERGAEGVLVQICLKCGKEYHFDDEPPPGDLACEKCGSEVFRTFHADAGGDEVREDYRESTERDTLTDDPATDVTRGDLHDLGNT